MAESISNTDDLTFENITDNADSNETSDGLIEMNSLNENEIDLNEMNSLFSDDVEYKLTESNSEKIPPSLLDKFDFKIDSETISSNNELIKNENNNDDDYIDEDLFHASGDDLEPINSIATTSKADFVTKLDDNPLKEEPELKKESILISTKTDIPNILCNEFSNNSEPCAKIKKHNEKKTTSSEYFSIKKINNENINQSEDKKEKIQFKPNEIFEYIIKKSKLKAEQKLSSLISNYQIEDHSPRKKTHNKTESIKLKSKNVCMLDSSESAFIWTELEAFIKQHEQTGPSSCGASAIINVMKALNFEIDNEKVSNLVKVNSRIPESKAATTTLAQYLFSRSIAGMNAIEMIENIQRVTSNKISGRFFPFHPSHHNRVAKWLSSWILKGAVPVALLNLQKTPIWGLTPDAWHHQMIYAISSNDVYLTNPLERKTIETMLKELNSESVLLVRSEDVIKRFNANPTNLNEFLVMKDHSITEKKRWFDSNVLGQVVNVLRNPANNTHIKIPASYVSGITLFANRDSNLFEEILLVK